ncbi:MAG: hypothetical protein E7091_05385 [Bacteroidales bacterium]|nr:hypothetical protein [Bacteroidales bacterium]
MGVADNTLIILTSDNGPVVDDGYADHAVELLGNHRPRRNYKFLSSQPTLIRVGGTADSCERSNAAHSA